MSIVRSFTRRRAQARPESSPASLPLGPSQMEQMVYHLREVHRLKQEDSLRRNDAGIATANEFTWRRTAEAVLRAVQ
jgi:hypothetical protein